MSELFPIPGYEGLYAITRDGRVWSYPKKCSVSRSHNGIWLSSYATDRGYRCIDLHKNKKKKKYFIHRLVAITCIPNFNINDKQYINHINEIKDDNRVENLEWCNCSENTQHSIYNIGCKRSSTKQSKYKWVSWNKQVKRWHVRITINGKRLHGGYYETEEAAQHMVVSLRSN